MIVYIKLERVSNNGSFWRFLMLVVHLLKKFILPFLIFLSCVYSSQAAERLYSGKKVPDYFCKTGNSFSYYRWGTIKKIVKPHFSVRGWSGKNAGAAAALGLEVSADKGREFYEVFEKKIKNATGFQGTEYSPGSTEDYKTRFDSYLSSSSESGMSNLKNVQQKRRV